MGDIAKTGAMKKRAAFRDYFLEKK